jgi:flagellar motor component MotA
MRVIGLGVIVALIFVTLGEDAMPLIDSVSFLIVSGVSLGIMLMSFDREWRAGFAALRNADADRTELLMGQAAMVRLRSAVIVSGVIGTLIGVVIMTAYMSDPAVLGSAMAILLLTQVYALAIGFCILHPLAAALAHRLDELPD